MPDLELIIAAIDFSECSHEALLTACGFAEKYGAKLHLVHVQKEPVPYHGYDLQPSDDVQRQMDAIPGPAWEAKLTVTRAVRFGPPAEEIVTEADEQDADLIVIGTHGRNAMQKLFLGSIAERVVRAADCPVMTVRPTPDAVSGQE